MNEIEKKILNPKNLTLLLFLLVIIFSLVFIFEVLYPFLVAFIIAYLLSPLTLKLNNYFSKVISSFMSILFFIVVIISIFSLIVPILVVQFEKLIQMAPFFAEKARKIIPYILESKVIFNEVDKDQIFDITKLVITNIGIAGNNIVTGSMIFFSSIFNFLLIFVLSFYMLLELNDLKVFFTKIAKSSNLNFFSKILDQINLSLSRYIRGQGLICFILSCFYSISLFTISLQFGVILGVFLGLISFIPYIGAFLGCLLALLLGFSQFGINIELFFIVLIFIVGQTLESYYLTPKFVGEAVKLNPLWIIFALSLGGKFFGIIGILIAIPLAAIIGVILRYWFSSVFIEK